MAQDVRFIIVNADDALRAELRSILLNISGVKIVAEVVEPALLERAVKQFQVDAVLLNLDNATKATNTKVCARLSRRMRDIWTICRKTKTSCLDHTK